MSEDERFGVAPDDDGSDPSSLQAGKEGDPTSAEGGDQPMEAATPRRRAANDKVTDGE
jgi:hypothetical protein